MHKTLFGMTSVKISNVWTTIVGVVFATCVVSVSFSPAIVQAETYIDYGYLFGNTVWTASSSPYILQDNLTIPRGNTLDIGPGVTVKADPSLDHEPSIYVGGQMNIRGTKENPIDMSGISYITIDNGTTTISGADIHTSGGLGFNYSKATISSSTLVGMPIMPDGSANDSPGLYVRASNIDITGSRITGNNVGIEVEPVVPVFMVDNRLPPDSGGIGNALDDIPAGSINLRGGDHITQSSVKVIPSTVTITNSSLVGNISTTIKNSENTSTVEATHNWWGSTDGPASTTIIGNVNYSPWLDHDPTAETVKTMCCSSVLFIPGLEATWLYRDESATTGIGANVKPSTNTLWAPNRNDDVRKLLLNSNGSSSDAGIYSGKPIDNVFGIYSIYGSFMKFLDEMINSGKIKEWKSFGYDWRKPITEVVAGAEKKATTTESLVNIATDLARRSPTGKINIVAHSNGGLVTKYLVKTLTDSGNGNLVDSIISVAVPYLGTPSAISGLLHGDHQSIAGGLILKPSVARQLGQNMSSAYPLLPSSGYFSKVNLPVISFASSSVTGINSGAYSQFIKSYKDMTDFIGDVFKNRIGPAITDTSKPIIGNSALISKANDVQSLLSKFSWPENIHHWSLVGWGKETTKGLVYSDKETCTTILWFKTNCSTTLARSENMTIMGDGTVVSPSAADLGVNSASSSTNSVTGISNANNISLDLASISRSENKNIDHANILESATTQSIIEKILSGSSQLASVIASTPSVSLGEPDYSKEPVRLVVSTEAQAELHVQDANGKHTGTITSPAGVEDDVVMAYEEGISGSHFSVGSDSDTVNNSRISMPDNGQKYIVTINGGGFGSFSLNMDRMQGSTMLGHAEFADIPMTPLSVATATILVAPLDSNVSNSNTVSTSTLSNILASSTSVISLDIDGDGTTDFVATSTVSSKEVSAVSTTGTTTASSTNDITRLELLKKYTSTLLGQGEQYRKLAKRFEKIEDMLKKGQIKELKSKKWSRNFIEKSMHKIGHRKLKNLKAGERKDFTDMVESMLVELER